LAGQRSVADEEHVDVFRKVFVPAVVLLGPHALRPGRLSRTGSQGGACGPGLPTVGPGNG
jgi:hypothetical protein